MIYLDNAATTTVLKNSAEAANKAYSEYFLNPSALYKNADGVRLQIDAARKTIAELLCAEPNEIYFTSGATEANNWAVLGGLKKKNLAAVSSLGEHASVHESFTLLNSKGIDVNFAKLCLDTSVDAENLLKIAAKDCGFVSLIHASNETGVINDIGEIFRVIKKQNPNVVVHSDGVQAFGKVNTDVDKLHVDLYSISGHKVGAPKGIGALYIRKGLKIQPLICGGGQERGLRSGTENVPGVLAFAVAATHYKNVYRKQADNFKVLRKYFFEYVSENAGNIVLNGKAADIGEYMPNILSISVVGIRAEILQRVLADEENILIGLGSACAASKKGNRVLQAAGKSMSEIEGNIRISFGIETTQEEVETAARIMVKRIKELRGKQNGR